MAKKLKAQLELDTSEARRKLRRDLSEAAESGGAGGASAGASRLAQSLDKAAASADKTASSFNMTQSSAMRLTRGFAGIAVGLATSYAANYVQDPNAKAGLGYLGNIAAGASSGAMLGSVVPGVGTAVGAIAGGGAAALKTYMDNEGEKSAMSKDFEQAEAIYAAVRQKNAKFQELSNTKDGANIAANLAEAKKTIESYTQTTADFVQQVRDELKKLNPDKEKIATLRRNIDYNRGEIQRYEALVKNLEEIENKPTPAARASMAALDSLSKIGGIVASPAVEIAAAADAVVSSTRSGGSFAFAVPSAGESDAIEFSARSEGLMSGVDAALKTANENIERIDKEQLQVLQQINETLRNNGGTTWQ